MSATGLRGRTEDRTGRRYHFSASHRLHSEHLTEEENNRVFGKCNNPFGHGHNYALEVTISGKVDPATGMIANLTDLDGFVERIVLDALDHKSLNEEVAAFREKVPTTENLCIEIYDRLKSFPHAKLERVQSRKRGIIALNMLERIAEVPDASAVPKGAKVSNQTKNCCCTSPSRIAKDDNIAALVRKMITLIGEDPNREGLRKTPERFEKAMKFLTSGYHQNVENVLNGATFSVAYDEMVIVKDIEFFSLCEHHLLPSSARCHVAYLPNKKVIGLSKVASPREYVRAPAADSGAADQPDRRRPSRRRSALKAWA